MTENQAQASEAYHAYLREYFDQKSYSECIQCVSVENVWRMRNVHRKAFVLPEGESIDNLCLSVFVREVPPDGVRLPQERYNGVRVFYTLVNPEKELPCTP